jgi:hypothetical protein
MILHCVVLQWKLKEIQMEKAKVTFLFCRSLLLTECNLRKIRHSRLSGVAKRFGLNYSRYADDIAQ